MLLYLSVIMSPFCLKGEWSVELIERNNLLDQISLVKPTNEAEVETKILLHIFRMLGYTDIDRADKPSLAMHFGREKKHKQPDFIIYDGYERTMSKALISVEAKAIGESLKDAEFQVISYAAWAGTPFYVVCNGESLLAAKYIPGVEKPKTIKFNICEITTFWPELDDFLRRSEVILEKERINFIVNNSVKIEELPASEFFKEYLIQLAARFAKLKEAKEALKPPLPGDTGSISWPFLPLNASIFVWPTYASKLYKNISRATNVEINLENIDRREF